MTDVPVVCHSPDALIGPCECALINLAISYSGRYLALFGYYRFLITRSGAALSAAGLVVRVCWGWPPLRGRQLSIV